MSFSPRGNISICGEGVIQEYVCICVCVSVCVYWVGMGILLEHSDKEENGQVRTWRLPHREEIHQSVGSGERRP